ncbi:MAG: peptide chain release factor N(5)-glutamine methyltransferase, partial [Clostridia bacterium]|nr:peptide chain release factor N(5)-glutamine methyltransferase [Clostridia bacterium]
VLDLCSGSGAIAIAIKLKTGAIVTASDISEKAVSLAKENAQKLNADITIIESDMFENIDGKFDLIVSNPPYIRTGDIQNLQKEISFEPLSALDGGEDGLDFYRILASEAKAHLNENGVMFLEFGVGQKEALIDLFKDFSKVEVIVDSFGNDRILRVES